MAKPLARARKLLVNGALAGVAILAALAAFEVGLRAVYLADPFDLRNFAADPVDQIRTNLAIEYDPVLGYIPRPGFRSPGDAPRYTQTAFGVRLHARPADGADPPAPPRGGILATGDSFTYGSEVDDGETWPAYLQSLLDMPVVNAGVGGYGLDQAVLRAEALAGVVAPRLVVVSLIPDGVSRGEASVNLGLPKPYFDLVAGAPALRNTPVPDYRPTSYHAGRLRGWFGYSYLVFQAMRRLGREQFWIVKTYEYRAAHARGFETACALMPRLAALGAKIGTPAVGPGVLLLVQYSGKQVEGLNDGRRKNRIAELADCAAAAGVPVLDTFEPLRRLFDGSPRALYALYVRQSTDADHRNGGHMSAAGNRLVAALLAARIRELRAGAPRGGRE